MVYRFKVVAVGTVISKFIIRWEVLPRGETRVAATVNQNPVLEITYSKRILKQLLL